MQRFRKCYLIDIMLIFGRSEMLCCYCKGTTEYLTCSIPLIARIRPMKFETLSALPSVTNISAQLSPRCVCEDYLLQCHRTHV